MEQFTVTIQIQLMKEGDTFVVYSPALDLCGYGKTEDDAKKDFDAALKIFIEETKAQGTLEKALNELGWKKVLVNDKPRWTPSIELINNPTEKEILLPAA